MVAPSFFSVGGVQRLMREIVAHSEHTFDVLVRRSQYNRRGAQASPACIFSSRFAFGLHHLKIAALLARRRYDAVYIASLRHAGAALLPSLAGVKVVSHAHGNDLFETRRTDPVTRQTLRWGQRRIDRFIAVSDWTRRQVLGLGVEATRVDMIPNGVDAARFRKTSASETRRRERRSALGLAEDDFALLTVARLVPRKGHRLVIEALRSLEGVKYVIAGKGPQRDALRRAAQDAGRADDVTFAGYVPEEALPGYYDACDAYVMPSEHLEDEGSVEGFGLAFLEANAAGKAVVGTRAGGIPSAVKHEHNGLLCDPDAASVRAAIERLRGDDALRETLEENAAAWAQEHDWSRIVARIDRALAA